MNTSTNTSTDNFTDIEPTDEQLIATAIELYGRDGSIEIDSDQDPSQSVSRGADAGAYVKASRWTRRSTWVWVDFSEVEDFSRELFTSNLSSK